MVSLLWSFGSKNLGSEAGCLCVTGDTNILHQLAVTLEWLLSYTCWQTHSWDDARENNESRDQALTRVTEKATKVVARLQSVNVDHYVEMLQNFFTPQLTRFPVNENMLFQQDGATSHTARMSMNTVNALFPNRVVSRNGDIPWPPRSPDLTPCNYFLWGYLKTKVFETRPRTIADLKQRIQDEVAARGHEQFQVPTWGMRPSKRKPSWGRYFQSINFQTGIKQNGCSYAFHLWPINR